MRWTIWQQRTKCQNCGARIAVPDEGLTMTCQYCGATAPVPDVEARQKIEVVARPQSQEGYFIQEKDRSKASAPGAGLMKMLIWGVILLVGIGLPLRFTGVLDHVTEPLLGGYGADDFQEASDRIRVSKYEQASRGKVEQYFYTQKKHYVSLKAGRCFALVLAAGKPFKKVTLMDPTGKVQQSHETLRLHDTLVHCANVAGAHALTVDLDHPGRYIWALFRKPRQEQTREVMPDQPRTNKVKRKRRSRRKRIRKPEPTPTAPIAEPAEPPPSQPPEDVDEEVRRAIKGSEITPGDL